MKKKTKTDTQKSPLQFHVQHLLKNSNFKSNKNETSKETGIGHFNICELIKPIESKKETRLLKAKRTFVFIKCKFWKHHRGMVQSKKTTLWCRSCQKNNTLLPSILHLFRKLCPIAVESCMGVLSRSYKEFLS